MATLPFSCTVGKEFAVSPLYIEVNPKSYVPTARVVTPDTFDLKVMNTLYMLFSILNFRYKDFGTVEPTTFQLVIMFSSMLTKI